MSNKHSKLLAFLMLLSMISMISMISLLLLVLVLVLRLGVRGSFVALLGHLANVLALPTLHRRRLPYVTNARSPMRSRRMNQYQWRI